MKFMWESFDDVLQAELQGDNRFTDFLGRYRLWAVWPPLVTSDGKWPSQNSGEAHVERRMLMCAVQSFEDLE